MNNTNNVDTPRTGEEIACRAIALHCVIAAAHGVSRDDITEWLREEELWDILTPREIRFMTTTNVSHKEISWMTWLVEAQVALLWAIEKFDRLPPLTAKCDTGTVIKVMPGLFTPTSPFIESASLRGLDELQREEEQLYDIRCEIAQAVRRGEPIPQDYDKDVAFFRHYGLSWIVGYCGQKWDEVTPDT